MSVTIETIKQKILEQAMRGELVEQDPNDEPVEILLEQIKEEKEKLIKEKKIKKQKPMQPIEEDEIPYELPKGWQWVRLGEVAELLNGRAYKKHELLDEGEGRTPVLRVGNFFTNNSWYYSDLELSDDKYCDNGDLLYAWSASFGPKIWNGGKVIYHYHIWKVNIFGGVSKQFLYFLLLKDVIDIKDVTTGSTMIHVTKANMEKRLFPLPPIQEQFRIAEKIKSLFSLCDKWEEEVTKQQNHLSVLRNKVLDDAMRGLLVEQDESDEPAEKLLEKIGEEREQLIKEKKIKKQKALPRIEEDEIPYDIPENWSWVRFGDVSFNRDGERVPLSKSERESRSGKYDYYGASGVIDKIDDYIFNESLLLIGEDGANLIRRKTPIAFIAEGEYWVNNHAHVIDAMEFTMLKFLEFYINSIDLKPYVTGTAQPKLNQSSLNKILIALPPLNEQKRIVEKIENIYEYIDQLEKHMVLPK
ncbi:MULTISPECIES: restriction endonuclease subunit S [Allobacillus]|uniref:Type I restriction modification DNA specificity domain-containing protein n=1 Tax=Allobacillus salarius TaxID=1955272 RepID=A0A556PDN8_9BACI|nr:restriction endonuclease subunit S [Allobacillus salarius]TSJ62499.1 hypothetical protein FPQ13_09905 [Allobacillus salarius]